MALQVNVHEAKTHFSKLLVKVREGQEIIIAKAGRWPALSRSWKGGYGAFREAPREKSSLPTISTPPWRKMSWLSSSHEILLDTHAFLWWVTNDRRLSSKAGEIIGDGSNDLFLSVASGWEMAIKAGLGKLTLPPPCPATTTR